MWLPFTTYAEILNTKTKIRIQSKYKYAGNRVWDCHVGQSLLAMTLKFLVDGFWFFVERQRQKMWG